MTNPAEPGISIPGHAVGNAGAGPITKSATNPRDAMRCVKVFAQDVSHHLGGGRVWVLRGPETDKDGRYGFLLDSGLSTLPLEVEMPGLPLADVRYMPDEPGNGDQNPWDFPRLYVDGSSWLWKYAVRTIAGMDSVVRFRIGDRVGARSACDHNTVFSFTVIKRTAKFVTLRRDNGADGEILRVGVKTDERGEWCMPFGSYSMAPVLRAHGGK